MSSTTISYVSLRMPTGLILILDDVLYVPTLSRNIISVSSLDKIGFVFFHKIMDYLLYQEIILFIALHLWLEDCTF